MDTISAKQVKGAVDQSSNQIIAGQKTFAEQLVIDKQRGTHDVVISQGFIYWTEDPANLDEDGNTRMGMVDGNLATQYYEEGKWRTS